MINAPYYKEYAHETLRIAKDNDIDLHEAMEMSKIMADLERNIVSAVNGSEEWIDEDGSFIMTIRLKAHHGDGPEMKTYIDHMMEKMREDVRGTPDE